MHGGRVNRRQLAVSPRAVLLAGTILASSALAQTSAPQVNSKQTPAPAQSTQGNVKAATPAAKPAGTPSRYLPDRFAGSAGRYYKLVWGIDSLSAKTVESGEIIRFSWHVLDPNLAKTLNDKKATPSLLDPQAGVSLVIPEMENIGQLRQTATPEAGKSYWMAFSNKGRLVKPGHRVNVVIGAFHADGLVVD
jgi:hypothetical protein